MLANCRRPRRIEKDAAVGAHADVGVDQGSTAEAAALEDTDVVVDTHVEEAGLRPDVAGGEIGLELLHDFKRRVRVFAGLELLAALEQTDGAAGPRQA